MRTIRRAALVATTAFLLTILLAPAAAEAAARSPYGRFTITYRNLSTYKWQVAEAVAVWNRAGTPFRLVPARPRTRAHITIRQQRYIGAPNSSTAGLGGIGFVTLSAARMKSARAFHNGQVRIVAHELGHALGLGHTPNRCAIMYSAQDYPTAARCRIAERQWDARQHCGPRTPDVLALRRMWGITLRSVAWRGYCTTPTTAVTGLARPYVAGTLSGEATQLPYDDGSGAVQVTLTNNGNTVHEIGSYGLVLVDAAGTIIPRAFRFGEWYWAVRNPPAPGGATTLPVPICSGELPLLMRIRLASQHHDAFLGPDLHVRVDTSEGDSNVPANECVSASS